LDVIRAIRERPELRIPSKNLRSIASSGYGAAEDIAASVEAGFDIHIVKPCEMQLLEQTICHLICPPITKKPSLVDSSAVIPSDK
jgi:CheY-like chemotaxis protein